MSNRLRCNLIEMVTGARTRNSCPKMSKKERNPHKVREMTTLMSCGCVREPCVPNTRGIRPQPSMFETTEHDGTDAENMSLLRKLIDDHLVQIERLRFRNEYSASAKERLALVNRQGSPRHRIWEALNEAVLTDLMWQDKQDREEIARANTVQGDRAHGISDKQPRNTSCTVADAGLQYPRQFTVGNQHIEAEMTVDSLGLVQLNKKDRLRASYVNVMLLRDFCEARKIQDQLDNTAEHERRKRRAEKDR